MSRLRLVVQLKGCIQFLVFGCIAMLIVGVLTNRTFQSKLCL